MSSVISLNQKFRYGLTEAKSSRTAQGVHMSLLDRPRLVQLVDEKLPPVVVLKAPAGYGKSTLLKQWTFRLEGRGESVVWISLDDSDNDPLRLAKKIVGSFARHQVGSAQQSAIGSSAGFQSAHDLLDNLSHSDFPVYVIVDELETLKSAESQNLIKRLVKQRWVGLTLIFATRSLPNLGISKLRVAGELLELGATQLRFYEDEIVGLFSKLGVALSFDLPHRFLRLTEGWPAVLELAAQFLKDGSTDAVQLLDRLPGPWPELEEYFVEEILDGLDSDTLRTLMLTGILRRFPQKLAGLVSGSTAIHDDLLRFQHLGLPIEDEMQDGLWFRYHPLFADYLERRIQTIDRAAYEFANKTAADWHSNNGSISDAVRHAYAVGDVDLTCDLLLRAGNERRRRGHFRAAKEWVDVIQERILDRAPPLEVEVACSYAALFDFEAARIHVNSAKARYADLDARARDDLLAVDAMIATYEDRPEQMLVTGQRGLRDCQVRDPYTLGTLHLVCALGWASHGEIEKAHHSVVEARACNQRAGNEFGAAISLTMTGLVHAIEGSLGMAYSAWNDAEDVVSRIGDSGTSRVIAIGYRPEILYEWNELDEAEDCLKDCFSGSLEVALPDMVTTLYLTASRVAYARNRGDEADQFLNDGEVVGIRLGWPRLVYAVSSERMRFALRRGRTDEAIRLMEKTKTEGFCEPLPGVMPHSVETEANLIGELRLEVYTSPSRALIARCRAAVSTAINEKRNWRVVRLLIIEALARDAMSERLAALRVIRRAVELASVGKLIRSFVDEGPRVVALLKIILKEEKSNPTSIPIDYLQAILLACGESIPSSYEGSEPMEAMSKREVEILKMLASGMSNKELGERLFVSEHTVKWHLQRVFAKLGVRNRTRAVATAREQGLIPGLK